MPFPALLIGAAAVVAGAVGVGKTVKAVMDNNEAEDINDSANSIVSKASSKADSAKKISQKSLEELGNTKITVISETIKPFVETFSLIKNVDFNECKGINGSECFLDKTELKELKQLSEFTTSLLSGGASGVLAGAATAFGAYSAVGILGTAGTGAAISGLSGVAATNATLAWLGGGTLAAGGLGMAGGAAVLGGLVAAPALLVLGCFLGSKASENLDDARSNYAKAKRYREEMETLCTLCEQISTSASFFRNTINQFNNAIQGGNDFLKKVIHTYSTDWNNYRIEDKKAIATIAKNIQAISVLINTPILNPDGSPSKEGEIDAITSEVNQKCGSVILNSDGSLSEEAKGSFNI